MFKFGLAVSMSALLASGALAQEADTEQRQNIVVVTGQKIDRSLQDTPVSVAVVTDVQFEEENIVDMVDALARTANVVSSDGTRFKIRGIDSNMVSGAGDGDLATVYVDGSPLPRQASFAGPTDIWDVEQIEIYRGPQSTLQGRASLAGAILVKTADPSYEWGGRARAIYTTEEEKYRVGMAYGGPIVEDQVAFRLAFERSESAGFGDNLTTGRELDPSDTLTARGKLLIEPANIPDLEVILSYSHDERSLGQEDFSLSVNDPFNNRVGFNNDPIEYEAVVDIATVTANYDINDEWSLTAIGGWNDVDYRYVYDDDLSAAAEATRTYLTLTETWTQEMRAQYDGEKLDGVFGIYLSKIEKPLSVSDGQLGIDLVNGIGLPLILQYQFGLDAATSNFVVSQYPNPAFINSRGAVSLETNTSAAFADLTWEFADQWTLYAGFRYDVEEQSGTTESIVTLGSVLPDPAAYPTPLDQVIAGVNGFLQAEAASANAPLTTYDSPSFGGFLPKLGIGYDFDDDKSLSFTVQRGYRSGGLGVNAAQATPFTFDQEFVWNYEFALRTQWLDGDLTANANAFYMDWTDQQVNVQLGTNVFDAETQNAGGSHIYGVELETSYVASDTLDLYGSVGYSKTEFDEFDVNINGVITDLSGNEFAYAPHWTLNAGATWRPTDNWIANVNANHVTSSFMDADRAQVSRESEARTHVNFRTGWEGETYGIFLAGKNLFNDESVVRVSPRLGTPEFASFADPRTFSIQVQAKF